jgi:hypothetical protein
MRYVGCTNYFRSNIFQRKRYNLRINRSTTMNLKDLDNTWREACPDEANGLVSKRKKGNRWNRILESAQARNKLKEKS